MENMPLGYRFYPTEEELITFYLHNKLEGEKEYINRVIPMVNIYDYNPSQLPQLSGEASLKDTEQWFFFIPRQESEVRGGRPKRLTTTGYWKATGSPNHVYSYDNRVIGLKRTMVFYNGRAPKGKKTDWKMNEYTAIKDEPSSSHRATPKLRKEFSLCRVYKKSKCLRAFDRRPPPKRSRVTTTTTTTTTRVQKAKEQQQQQQKESSSTLCNDLIPSTSLPEKSFVEYHDDGQPSNDVVGEATNIMNIFDYEPLDWERVDWFLGADLWNHDMNNSR